MAKKYSQFEGMCSEVCFLRHIRQTAESLQVIVRI